MSSSFDIDVVVEATLKVVAVVLVLDGLVFLLE